MNGASAAGRRRFIPLSLFDGTGYCVPEARINYKRHEPRAEILAISALMS
jgi:hypothetical protein